VGAARSRKTPRADRRAGEGNRWCERTAASLGKYYSAIAESHAHTDAEPDTVGISLQQPHSGGPVADFDVCISDREPVAVAIAVRFFTGARPSRLCGRQASRLSNRLTMTRRRDARGPHRPEDRAPMNRRFVNRRSLMAAPKGAQRQLARLDHRIMQLEDSLQISFGRGDA
jgi:hypothetical protein